LAPTEVLKNCPLGPVHEEEVDYLAYCGEGFEMSKNVDLMGKVIK
jgi:hypothetical protein